jgi:hypothetical protein
VVEASATLALADIHVSSLDVLEAMHYGQPTVAIISAVGGEECYLPAGVLRTVTT